MTEFVFSSNWLNMANLARLQRLLALRTGPVHVLELGTYEGRSAFYMLEHFCGHPHSTITTVDFEKRHNLEHNLNLCDTSKLQFVHEDFFNILPRLLTEHKLYDLIYIDGGKDSTLTIFQIVNSWRLLKSGGILYMDDYLWKNKSGSTERPKEAIDCFLFLYKNDFTILFKNYQVAVQKK